MPSGLPASPQPAGNIRLNSLVHVAAKRLRMSILGFRPTIFTLSIIGQASAPGVGKCPLARRTTHRNRRRTGSTPRIAVRRTTTPEGIFPYMHSYQCKLKPTSHKTDGLLFALVAAKGFEPLTLRV